MQQQLHTILCHPERSEGSHFQIYKYSNFQILLFSILYSLFSIPATAQQYEWDWATYGGSDNGRNGWDYKSEQVYDIVVGTDDNYYFLASINRSSVGGKDSQLAGQPVTVYNSYASSALDIFLFSTTCDGQVRWSQTIGGGMIRHTK